MDFTQDNSTEKLTCMDIAKGMPDFENAVCAQVNGELVVLSTVVYSKDEVQIVYAKDEKALPVFRATCSRIFEHAVKNIYPTCKLSYAPVTKDGFYCDVDFVTPITNEDLAQIESEMNKIIKAGFEIEHFVYTKKKAISLMRSFDEKYKMQIIDNISDGKTINVYREGGFTDFSKYPLLKNTSMIKAFKIESMAGAYIGGNKHSRMLTRIYVACFQRRSQLTEYFAKKKEAKAKEHNVLGRKLGYFMTENGIGQGFNILLEKGAKVLKILKRYVEDYEEANGFSFVETPCVGKDGIYKKDKESASEKAFYIDGGDKKYVLRSHTCEFQYKIYKAKPRSYRDLPVRYAETATVFRNENSGGISGLKTVKQFTLSDGHILCSPESVGAEMIRCLDISVKLLEKLGLSGYYVRYCEQKGQTLSFEKTLKDELSARKIKYRSTSNSGRYDGERLEIRFKNLLGKEETLISMHADYESARLYGLKFTDRDGEKKYVAVIHRTAVGSYERLLALLLERYEGSLPFWLAPVQVKILSVTERNAEYVQNVCQQLRVCGIRAEADVRDEKTGKKVRQAHEDRVPCIAIAGDNESDNGLLFVRKGEFTGTISCQDFISKLFFQSKN